MNTIWPVALITFKEGLRHRVIYGVVIASLFLIFFAVLFCGLYMRDLLKILLDICLSAISISGILVPLFFAVHQLAGDIERRTIYTILSRPVSRTQYIVGRFMGLALLSGSIMAILTASTIISVYGAKAIHPPYMFSYFSLKAVLLCSLAGFMGVQILNSTVLFWCSVTTSSFLATLLTISTYLIGHTVEDIVHFIKTQSSQIYISPLAQHITNITQYIFPNLAAFDLKQQAAYGLSIPPSEMMLLLFYSIIYCSIMLLSAVFFFKKRDL